MLFARRAGALLLGAAIAVIPAVSHSAPEIGAYRWDVPAGPANIDGFSDWLGSAVTIASLFHGRNTWSEIEGQDAQLSAWSQWVRAQNGRNVVIAIGMFPPGGSLASCAAGSYDANWRRLADNIAFHGLHWAYLRLGWQMEIAGNEWAAPPGSGKEASYAGCFRRIVQAMRQEQPANEPHSSQHHGPRRRILIAEDHPDVLESFKMMLQILGYEVETALDGIEALEKAEKMKASA